RAEAAGQRRAVCEPGPAARSVRLGELTTINTSTAPPARPVSTVRAGRLSSTLRPMSARDAITLPISGVRLSLWRAACLFRVAGLVVCGVLIIKWQSLYERPGIALLAGAGMAATTGVVCWFGLRGRAHRWSFVLIDLLVTVGLTLLTIPAQTSTQRHG